VSSGGSMTMVANASADAGDWTTTNNERVISDLTLMLCFSGARGVVETKRVDQTEAYI
jgi:hypothetical protein